MKRDMILWMAIGAFGMVAFHACSPAQMSAEKAALQITCEDVAPLAKAILDRKLDGGRE